MNRVVGEQPIVCGFSSATRGRTGGNYFSHFADAEFGEWFGYLQDGTPSGRLKGNMWKGPFHLPRMLWHCLRLLENPPAKVESFRNSS